MLGKPPPHPTLGQRSPLGSQNFKRERLENLPEPLAGPGAAAACSLNTGRKAATPFNEEKSWAGGWQDAAGEEWGGRGEERREEGEGGGAERRWGAGAGLSKGRWAGGFLAPAPFCLPPLSGSL